MTAIAKLFASGSIDLVVYLGWLIGTGSLAKGTAYYT